MSVAGRAALVAGAGAVGTAVARALAGAGARVAIADPDASRMRTLIANLEAAGLSAATVAHGASTAAEAAALVDEARTKLSGLHILVTAFDVAADDEFLSIGLEAWNTVLTGNLTRVFLICQAAAAHMVEQEYGRIVNLAARDWLGWNHRANYAASKAGVIGLTRTIAWELVGRGITANAVAPGWIDDEYAAGLDPSTVASALQSQPIARLGLPDEVAAAVLFMAGDEACYLTGQTLYVDGGRSVLSSLTA